MPVEVTRIKGRFKELFKADLSNKRLDELSARLASKLADEAEDSEIDVLLNNANDIYPFTEMVKDEHRLVAAELKLKNQKPSDPPAPSPDPTPNPTPKDDVPLWAQTMMDELKGIKEGKVIESKTQAARAEFEKNEIFKGIPQKGKDLYFRQIDINSELPIAEQIKALEETHLEITQSKADATEVAGKPPASVAGSAASKELIDKIVGNKAKA